jgi:multiple antibiotic resistance protein
VEVVPDVTHYLKVFVAIFILVNPFEGIPFFLSATEAMTPTDRDRVARRAAIGVTIILLISLVIGRLILSVFGITTPAFQTAGGVIVFLIGLRMVLSSPDAGAAKATAVAHRDIAIVPLATPLLAGPGPISSVIVYASHSPGAMNYAVLGFIILVVGAATLLSLRLAEPVARRMGPTGVDISSRIMGLLVTAIALEMIISGVTKLLPGLGR